MASTATDTVHVEITGDSRELVEACRRAERSLVLLDKVARKHRLGSTVYLLMKTPRWRLARRWLLRRRIVRELLANGGGGGGIENSADDGHGLSPSRRVKARARHRTQKGQR